MNNLQLSTNPPDIRQVAWNSLSEATKEAYEKDLMLFGRQYDLNKATSADILNYIKTLKKDGAKNATINRKVSSLSKFFKVQILAKTRQDNPVEQLKNISKVYTPVSNRVNEVLTAEELSHTIKNAKPKVSLIIETLALNTALRISELINIRHPDIKNHNEKYVTIHVRGKNNKEGDVYITKDLYSRILKVFPKIQETDYLFYTKFNDKYSRKVLWKLITDEFKRLIGRSIRPHFLRHAWATLQLERGKDIKQISKYLRHSTIATTLNFYIDTAVKAEDSNIILEG